jgi:pSer/pThr/pTyr-binding forkhead associated (FHA) protein
MRLTLRPLCLAGSAQIVVDGGSRSIGRYEAPFADLIRASLLRRQDLERMSRDHALITGKDSGFWLRDAEGGSLNGTFVNGARLGSEAVRLRTGDVVSFGGIEFRAEVEASEPDPRQTEADTPPSREADGAAELTLSPVDGNPNAGPIVIRQFPFPIGREEPCFARLRAAEPRALSWLSRQHAEIAREGARFLIRDLGSRNGTRVGGQRLSPDVPVEIRDGDIVGFAKALFYGVRVR